VKHLFKLDIFTGSCIWLIIATIAKMPVSATHSIVGSTVGFALVAHGTEGIQWRKLGMIGWLCFIYILVMFLI